MDLHSTTSSKKRILLIDPRGFGSGLNLGLGYLAAVLIRDGHEVKVIDCNNNPARLSSGSRLRLKKLTLPDWKDRIKDGLLWEPDIIGFSINSFTLPSALEIADFCRHNLPYTPVFVAGGPHVTIFKEDFLKKCSSYFDIGIIGEGENTIVDLVNNLTNLERVAGIVFLNRETGEVFKTVDRELILDLDQLPFPNFDVFDTVSLSKTLSNYQIISSRGCPYGCVFCCQVWSKRWRARSVENIIEEIKASREKYGIQSLTFWDDNFTFYLERAKNFCRVYKESGINLPFVLAGVRADRVDEELISLLKEAGCNGVSLGIEDGDPETFKYVGKGENLDDIVQAVGWLKKYDIPLIAYMITGLINHTYSSFSNSLSFIKKLGIKVHWSIAFPFPTTQLDAYVNQYGRRLMSLEEGFKKSMTSFDPPVVFDTPEYTKDERLAAYYLGNLRSQSYDLVVSSRESSLILQIKEVFQAIWKYDRKLFCWHLVNLFKLGYEMSGLKKMVPKILSWLFLLGLGLLPLLWFKKNLLIAGGDEYGFLDQGAFTKFLIYIWNNQLANAGGLSLAVPRLIPMSLFWSFLSYLKLSLPFIQRLWAVLTFFFTAWSIYHLTGKLGISLLGRLISAFLYCCNLFIIVAGPFQSNLRPLFIVLPLLLLIWQKAISKKEAPLRFYFKQSFFFGLVSLIVAGSSTNPPSLIAIPLTIGLYTVWHLSTEKYPFLHYLKVGVMFIFSYLFVNSWWVLNFFFNFLSQSDQIKGVAAFSALNSGEILDFFRLLGSWGWRSGHYGMPYYPFASSYDSLFLVLLSFTIPLLAFLPALRSLRESKRHVSLFFIILSLVALFLSKGASPPFGFIYKWLWQNIPGFWVFREPFAKFTPVTVFSYSVLLGFSFDYLNQVLKRLVSKKLTLLKILSSGLAVFFFTVIALVSYPMLTGEFIWNSWNGSMRSFHSVLPNYWQEAAVWVDHNTSPDSRFLSFPRGGYGIAYNWPHGFSSADDPATVVLPRQVLRASFPLSHTDILLNSLYKAALDNNIGLFNRLASLLGVSHIIQENDLDWRFSSGALSPSRANSFLEEAGWSVVSEFGKFDNEYLNSIPNQEREPYLNTLLYKELLEKPALVVRQIPEHLALPRIYAPEEISFSNNQTELLLEHFLPDESCVSLATYSIGEPDFLSQEKQNSRSLFDYSSINIIYPELGDLVSNTVTMPEARVLPDSPLYWLVEFKERFLLKKEKIPLSNLRLYLWFTSKRIVEADQLLELRRLKSGMRACDTYLSYLKKFISSLETISYENPESVSLIDEAKLTFIKHREILEKLSNDLNSNDFDDRLPNIFNQFGRLGDMSAKEKSSVFFFSNNQPGDYNFLIQKEDSFCKEFSYKSEDEVSLLIDRKELITLRNPTLSGGFLDYGILHLEPGNHTITVASPLSDDLSASFGGFEDISFWKDYSFITLSSDALEGDYSLRISSDPGAVTTLPIPLPSLSPYDSYHVSFDYRLLSGNPFKISFLSNQNDSKEGSYISNLGKSNYWQNFSQDITNTDKPFDRMAIYSLPGVEKSIILIDNFKVERVYTPLVFLRIPSKEEGILKLASPRVSFYQINPTRYEIKISEITGDFSLVFLDSYHPGWRLFLGDAVFKEENTKNGRATLGSKVTVGSYLDKFIYHGFLKNLSSIPIAGNRSYLANGYANSWFISQADLKGQSEVTLSLEFCPQRWLYIGGVVSTFFLLGGSLYLLFKRST